MNAKLKYFLKEWVMPIAIAVVTVLLLIRFVFFLVVVPTGSMVPTIEEHSWLFATRVYFPDKTIQRGDIIVFQSDEMGLTLVKRVVGLPGEHVEIDENGRVSINGESYPEPYVVNTSEKEGAFDIPENCYLFLGDNRKYSEDARYWENPYIPADKIIGEVRFTLYPFSHFGGFN